MKKKLTIVGCGATGACIAAHAYKKFNDTVDIQVIDPNATIGLGKAYKTHDTENLLNVGVANMGLYHSEPTHFQSWIKNNNLSDKHSEFWPFVPRKIFGEYILSELSRIPLTHIKDTVSGVTQNSDGYLLQLKSGLIVQTDFLVISTGYREENNIFSHLIDKDSCEHIHYPQEIEAKNFKDGENILIVGSGLTAIDVWKRLRKYELKLTFLSRHGLFPLTHVSSEAIHRFPNLTGMSPLQIFEVVRSLKGLYNWQQIADEIRKQNRGIWTCWSAREKKQFIRWIKPYWEIMRHRLPGAIHTMLQDDLSAGKARLKAGKVRNISRDTHKLNVDLKVKKAGVEQLTFDHIVLATGASINQDLFRDKKVPGIKFSSNGFGYINVSAPNVWFAGPSSKATYWEITAIPDIRIQAAEIIDNISERLLNERNSKFLEHPNSTGESYFEHMLQAMSFSRVLFTKALHSAIHGIFPFYYTDKTSNDLRDFSKKLSKRRQKDFKP